jgi:O-antigen/teichoic acid export membrane protein
MIFAIALGGVGLVIYGIQGASDSMLAGFERLDLSAAAKLINQLVFVVLGAAALWLGLSYPGLMVAAILGAAVIAYLSWRWVRRLGVAPGRASARSWRALLGASLPFAIGGLALAFSYKFDSVLLNIFRGDAETGYYNAAYNLVFAAAFVPYSLNSALYPSLIRHEASMVDDLPRVCERVMRYLLIVGLPIAATAWVLADRVVPILFTAAYVAAIPALQIVMLVTPLLFVSNLLGYVALIQRFERRAARAAIVSTSLNVALNLLLVPRFGLLAAAVMTVLTEAVLVAQYVWILRSTMRQLDWGMALVRPLAAALSMGGLLLALHDLPLLISIPSGTAAYLVLLLALGVIGADEFRFLRDLRSTSSLVVAVRTDSQR